MGELFKVLKPFHHDDEKLQVRRGLAWWPSTLISTLNRGLVCARARQQPGTWLVHSSGDL